ncbi:hypothetical protein ACFYZJ_28320 [Streptomyces sp. NPDC001848]|uniref:hypothetical protein n=1 Tax=Streptomyces sp. NPDC001848 TaxID=3364618 RepID=UPI0036B4CAD2
MSRLHCCARALSDGGRLVIEAAVPGSSALPLESGIFVRAVGQDYAKVSVVAHDPVTQALRSQEVQLDAEGMRLRHVTRRYTHLPELDLMASVTELRLEARPSGWTLAPYPAHQPRHIDVYSVARELGGGLGDG